MHKPASLIGAAWGIGALDPGCAAGPGELQRRGLPDALVARGIDAAWVATIAEDPQHADAEAVSALCNQLSHEVRKAIEKGRLPIVLGGDHTCALGTWRGVHEALRPQGPIGLLWIDAHLDSHTPATSPSGAMHGMPLACLLGRGSPALACGEAALSPHNVCIVGARSFEAEEAALLMHLGVRVFTMAEVCRRGLATVMHEALRIVCDGTTAFGLTLDLDVLDPHEAPGVGSPADHGLPLAGLCSALTALTRHPGLAAIEIAEYNPAHDRAHRTARAVEELLVALLLRPAIDADTLMTMEHTYGAHNYDPLPVVLARGKGVYLWDIDGRRYLDMMSAYSAVTLGHAHPRILRVLEQQSHRLNVTSRAYFNDQLPPFLRRLVELTGLAQALPVNTGLEAVETAIKAARKWGHTIKGIARDQAEIIACTGNFHGRSTTLISLSSEAQYREGFGPLTPGFKLVPFGDASALERAITPRTAAFLVEPIQGEAGIVVPPAGYLARCAEICRAHDVLLICDEVQTGLGRTGRLFACEHDGVRPDGIILGKALGGGVLPVSAFVASADVMQVFTPGDHGSTFGGNALAAAVGLAALETLIEDDLVSRAADLGDYLLRELQAIDCVAVRQVRGRGLFIGVDIDPARASARTICEQLMTRGLLSKETHGTVVRLAPPLIVERTQLEWAVAQIREVLAAAGDTGRKIAGGRRG